MTGNRANQGEARKPPGGRSRGSRQANYKAWFATLAGFAAYGVKTLKRAELAVFLLLLRDTRPDGTARAGLTDLAARPDAVTGAPPSNASPNWSGGPNGCGSAS